MRRHRSAPPSSPGLTGRSRAATLGRMKHVHVYILASRKNGVLYVGVTSDLARRLEQHRAPSPTAFTARYNVHRLVHVETYDDAETAIRREKRLKAWPRSWKIALFEGDNPERTDRADELLR